VGRGSDQATGAATSAQTLSNEYGSNASGIFSSLAPQLMTEAAHPAGMSPTDLAAANTSSQQSAGGGQSAAVGQGALLAGRTRNAGSADAAIAKSTETTGKNLSQASLQTQLKNASLKEQQQQEGLKGLEGLYGQNVGASVNALGEVASNVNANTNAENASWDWAKDVMDPLMGDVTSLGVADINRLGKKGGG